MKKKKNKPLVKPFTTAHKLPFEAAPWKKCYDFVLFRVGTCEGTWRSTPCYYEISAVVNTVPGNGHLQDLMQWFSHSCRRDGKDLRILDVMNKKFCRHLIEKKGFVAEGDHCIKKFT